MVFALRGNTALAIYFNAVISTSSGHRWSSAPTMYIYIFFFYVVILHHLDVTERQFLAKPIGVGRALKLFFFTVVFNKD